MSDIIQTTSYAGHLLPVRSEVLIRPAVAGDVTFIDKLQRIHSSNVGWMPTSVLARKIELGEIIIAEQAAQPIGYCMGQDRYFKRDDVGIIYQMNILPGSQRGLVGAALLKAQFDRSAYGCRLYCCWCAQDLAANRFWEAMGFVALAFRAGSRGKRRVHIFWQRRIRAGDTTTPYWFPSQTGAGAMKEDRIVLPIPPGTHWNEVRPTVLPEEECRVPGSEARVSGEDRKRLLPSSRNPEPETRNPRTTPAMGGKLQFVAAKVAGPEQSRREKPKEKTKRKNDPKLVAAARELRDKWLEQVNAPGGNALLSCHAKYDVARALSGGAAGVVDVPRIRQIAA